MIKTKHFPSKMLNAVMITAIISFALAVIGFWAMDAARTFQIQSLIAGNLAAQGLEAVRSVRNVNWIKYREDPKKCWMNMPQTNICSPDNAIRSGNFSLHGTNDINEWELAAAVAPQETELNLNTDNKINESYLVKDSPAAAESGTDFYRMIEIKYESDEEVTVISTVRWNTFFGVQASRLATTLTNHISVKND